MNLIVIKAELRRTLEESKNYWFQTITNIISTAIFFFGFAFAVPPSNRGSNLFLLISMLLWFYSLEIINQMSHYILEEKYFGTIEKLFLSPYGPIMVLSSRALSSIALTSIIVLIMFMCIGPIVGVSLLSVNIPMVIAIIIILIGLFGFGLLLAGLTVLSSRTSSFSEILIYVMLFASGMLFPLNDLHPVLGYLIRLLPLTNGVQLLRDLTSSVGVSEAILALEFTAVVVYTIVAVIVGLLVFRYAVKTAKAKGLLHVV